MLSPDSVLIIGAGLAGLSCARHLGGGRVLEKEHAVGGLCRSYRRQGYTFDFTGHFLHVKQATTIELLEEIAPGAFVRQDRRARIFSHGRLTRYPFQANLHGLPEEVIEECLRGLREADAHRGERSPDNFRDWIEATFGSGIARHFMLPYNRKMWSVPPEEMTIEWVSGMVPVPRYEDVERGARSPAEVTMGYNVNFLYPAEGGIEALPRALAADMPYLHLGREVIAVDTRRRKVECADGSTFRYETLVSTMPLPLLIRALIDVPPRIAEAAEGLRFVSVLDLNIGVARAATSDAHWIYFPEPVFPFYRVGLPGNAGRGLCPDGCSSLFVEISRAPEESNDVTEIIEPCLMGLRRAGLLLPDEPIELIDAVKIPCAYVIFDRHRAAALHGIQAWLRERGIHSIGRYGSWAYYSMEDAMEDGRRSAALIASSHD